MARWTKEEDQILIRTISRKSENLSYAFFLASKKLNRTPEAVELRYYSALRPYFLAHPDEAPFHNIDKKKDNGVIKNASRYTNVKEHQKKLNKSFRVKFKEALKILFSE